MGAERAVGFVGPRVLAARRRAGITREELAVRCGLSWSAIAQIESGRRPNPRAETLAALGRALGVTTDHLLGHDGATPPLLTHHALIYSGLDDFVDTAGAFVSEGVTAGEPTLVVTNPRNADALREHLGPSARGVRFGDSGGWYRSPRAAFAAYRDFATEALGAGATWLRVVGEPSWAERSGDAVSRWARYESLLNLAFASLPLTLVCPYDATALPAQIVEKARIAHGNTLARGELTPNAEFRDPAEFCLGD